MIALYIRSCSELILSLTLSSMGQCYMVAPQTRGSARVTLFSVHLVPANFVIQTDRGHKPVRQTHAVDCVFECSTSLYLSENNGD